MNLIEMASKNGRVYKRVSGIHGGEYHGPCPACGGNDRFHLWPEQGEHGTFWCRSCSLGGDAIEYLMKLEGLSFPAACKAVGKEPTDQEDYQAPKFKRPAGVSESFTARETTAASGLWVQHATKLVDWAHQQLLADPIQLAWLADRGLNLDAVKAYHLGWNPGEKGNDLYRAREAWGLDTVLNDKQKPKKLWLPVGLTIPYIVGETLQRIRIRRPAGEPRYYLVPGSNTAPMVLSGESRGFVIVESELDALLIHHLAGDLVGAISQGNSTAKPDTTSAACLTNSLAILIALDSDTAGMQAAVWWKKQYPQAERWPVPVGKDPGEAYQSGINLRQWIQAGLPPVFNMPKAPERVQQQPAESPRPQDDSGPLIPAAAAECEPGAQVFTFTAKDGRQFHVTDNRGEYARLTAAGQIVFDSKEIAFVKLSGADRDQAACFLNAKQIFPGIQITSVQHV